MKVLFYLLFLFTITKSQDDDVSQLYPAFGTNNEDILVRQQENDKP